MSTCTHSFPDPFPQPISQIGDCRGCGISYQEAKAAMTTPSEELRAASARLRELATAASTDNDGTPTAHWHTKPCWPKDDDSNRFLYGDHLTRDDGRTISWPLLLRGGMRRRAPYMHGQHAEYAAAMGPTVGLALAKLLETAAKHYDDGFLCCEHGPDSCSEVVAPALAVARQINAGSQT